MMALTSDQEEQSKLELPSGAERDFSAFDFRERWSAGGKG